MGFADEDYVRRAGGPQALNQLVDLGLAQCQLWASVEHDDLGLASETISTPRGFDELDAVSFGCSYAFRIWGKMSIKCGACA